MSRTTRWLWAALLAASAVCAGPITFDKVIDSHSGFLDDFATPSYNDQGLLAFWGQQTSTGNTGVFTISGPVGGPVGAVNTIGDTSGSFTGFQPNSPQVNNSGSVVFGGSTASGNGIYLYNGSTVSTLMDSTTTVSAMGHPSVQLGPSLNDAGTAAWSASFNNNWKGVFTSSSSLPAYWSNPYNTVFGPVASNNTGLLAFAMKPDVGQSSILTIDTAHGNAQSTWTHSAVYDLYNVSTAMPALNDNGLMAFAAEDHSHQMSLYLANAGGVTDKLAGPGQWGSSLAINNNGMVLYASNTYGAATDLYAWQNGTSTKLLSVGDLIDGRPVTDFSFGSGSLNNSSQLAIYAKFTDGTTGLYVANLSAVPEPGTVCALLFGGLAVFRRRRKTT